MRVKDFFLFRREVLKRRAQRCSLTRIVPKAVIGLNEDCLWDKFWMNQTLNGQRETVIQGLSPRKTNQDPTGDGYRCG